MIKLPKEVNKIIRTLEDSGFAAYVTGPCLRDSLLGDQPADWDLMAEAPIEVLKEKFPKAKIVSENPDIARLDFTVEGADQDRGIIADIISVPSTAADYLNEADFTINAMGDNPSGALLDPHNGRSDLKARLIRTVGDPNASFTEKPIGMLRAVSLAAELNFDLHISVFEGIKEKQHLITHVAPEEIREEFLKILGSEHCGKGLKMLVGTDLMVHILGEDVAAHVNKREMSIFDDLTEGIDKTLRVPERRLGLFYICFDTKKALSAIEKLHYDSETKQHLIDAQYLMETMCFMATKHDVKEFLVRYGMDRYEYLHDLAKAQRIVYDLSEVKIMNRYYMLQDIIKNGEPIYVEDLAIDANDIIEAGIADGEKAEQLLVMLTDVIHRKPRENTREDLLRHAAKFAKNKPAATFRKVKWLK